MPMHKIRSFAAAVVALVAVVLLSAFGAAAMDMDVPILRDITKAFGY